MKRLVSFVIACLIFILNCLSVFALDSFVIENFINVTFNDTIITFINDNLENKYLYYLMFRKNGSNNQVILSSTQELSFVQNPDNSKEITVSNLSTDLAVLSSNSSYFNKGEIAGSFSFTVNPGGDTNYKISPQLLIYNKDCVNLNYCSSDVFVEMTDPDDYEEDGVVIKGLSGFFSNVKNSLVEIKNSIVNLPDTILNGLKDLLVPDFENMKSSFSDFITYLEELWGFGPIIDTLKSMLDFDNTSVGAADVNKSISFKIGGSSVPVEFSIPFSSILTSDIKNTISGYLKGFFFVLLIFYNLSQIYLLIRGVESFKSSQQVKSVRLVE